MWEMRGIDVELDTNIGKRLSALGQTLTSLTGEEDESYLLEQSLERLDVSLEDMTDFPLVGSILALSTNIGHTVSVDSIFFMIMSILIMIFSIIISFKLTIPCLGLLEISYNL